MDPSVHTVRTTEFRDGKSASHNYKHIFHILLSNVTGDYIANTGRAAGVLPWGRPFLVHYPISFDDRGFHQVTLYMEGFVHILLIKSNWV